MVFNNPLKRFLISLITCYRYAFSACVGHCCRFHPTCSAYASEAIEQFGCIKGLYLTARRVLRCHPWHPGGFDPVNNLNGVSHDR